MTATLYHGDAATVLATLPPATVRCCVTSPPYFGLRDYQAVGLPRRCLLAGSAPGDTVLDPFGGSGTTAAVAVGAGRHALHRFTPWVAG